MMYKSRGGGDLSHPRYLLWQCVCVWVGGCLLPRDGYVAANYEWVGGVYCLGGVGVWQAGANYASRGWNKLEADSMHTPSRLCIWGCVCGRGREGDL